MEAYGEQWAANYERLATASIAGREGLYRLCAAYLSELPNNARILVVGCGTGEELIALAKALPRAQLDALDPSEPMLQICTQRVDQEGMAERISLHHSTLAEYAPSTTFDGATSILVSQHLRADSDAQLFFKQIAACLKPSGLLYSADLHVGIDHNLDAVFDLWRQSLVIAGIDKTMADGMMQKVKADICIREEQAITGFLRGAGFTDIIKPFHSLMYGAWAARKT